MKFKLKSNWKPAGDQPKAIEALVQGLEKGYDKQTLLGVTGSGKTFTMANVIQQIQKPTLIIAHNKTLAAQLAQEFKEFFPENAVHYFVSYYDYYQPEAYLPISDTYIEKDAQINEEIDRLRHASTQSLLLRNDVIIVASVSCIYGLGSPEEYQESHMMLKAGDILDRTELIRRLVGIHYERTTADLTSGTFRSLGNKVEIMPVSEKLMYTIWFEGNKISNIQLIDPVSSKVLEEDVKDFFLFPAKHFLTEGDKKERALKSVEAELEVQLKKFESEGKLLEAERLKRRTRYDLAMIREIGYTNGIENYSRHLSGKAPGEPPETLLAYFKRNIFGGEGRDFLTIIDESHVTLPQLRAMYAGDQSRKGTLVEFGFRLPSALDNRPLRYEEFEKRIGQVVYTSATPTEYEKQESKQVVQQVIRPTGLVDPEVIIRPVSVVEKGLGQVQDFIQESIEEIKKGGRVLATTLTKKMAEDLSMYLKDQKIKSEYLHSDIKTIDRIKIITDFRKGKYDILVGVNLLREGLDMPEVSLIGILDADKEGFLRSETSLIQTIGRAARNVNGRVILYADEMTGSMERAIGETSRRRTLQLEYNKKHGITPTTIAKEIKDITEHMESEHDKAVQLDLEAELGKLDKLPVKKRGGELKKIIKRKREEMNEAVQLLDFESAAILRDEINFLEGSGEAK